MSSQTAKTSRNFISYPYSYKSTGNSKDRSLRLATQELVEKRMLYQTQQCYRSLASKQREFPFGQILDTTKRRCSALQCFSFFRVRYLTVLIPLVYKATSVLNALYSVRILPLLVLYFTILLLPVYYCYQQSTYRTFLLHLVSILRMIYK